MSINLINPTTVQGSVDAAANFVSQLRIAMMVGDKRHQEACVAEIERHLNNALERIEELNITD